MPGNARPITNSQSLVENALDRQHFSRSRHQYYHHSIGFSGSSAGQSADQLEQAPTQQLHPEQDGISQHGSDYFNADTRKRPKQLTSPSASGTEADDERPPFLKGLPAPPLRPKKGLKDVKSTGFGPFQSPYLTPSYLDVDPRSLPTGTRAKKQGPEKEQAFEVGEAKRIQEKNTKRRRAEFARRILETSLLGGVGYGCFRTAGADLRDGI